MVATVGLRFTSPGVYAIVYIRTGDYYIGSSANIAATVLAILEGQCWSFVNAMSLVLANGLPRAQYEYQFLLLATTPTIASAIALADTLIEENDPSINTQDNDTLTVTLRHPLGGTYTITQYHSGVRGMHTSARTSRKIDSGFLSKVLKPALETDKGQESDNVYIIAKRFMASGEKPNAEIINKVLKLPDVVISEEHMNMFYNLYNNRVHIDSLPISPEVMKVKVRSRIESGNDVGGAYIFTHVPTNDQYVGSSQKLIWRTKCHYSYQSKECTIADRIVVDRRESYTLDYVMLPAVHQTRSMTLALEQFLFFLLKPNINTLVVANSTLKEYTDEEIATMRKLTGKTVYMYYKNTLIHVFDSIAYCGVALTGSETSRVIKQALTKYKGRYYTDLLFSEKPLDNMETNLLSLNEVQTIFMTVRNNNKVTRRLPSNTVPIYTEKDGLRVYHDSMEKAAVWVSEQLGRRVPSQSLNRAVKTPTQTYQGYKIVRSNKPLGYNNNYNDNP